MKKIWAPWRDEYVLSTIKKSKGCVFCKILKEKKDKKNYIFVRGDHCFAVLNIYPYNNGHSLVQLSHNIPPLLFCIIPNNSSASLQFYQIKSKNKRLSIQNVVMNLQCELIMETSGCTCSGEFPLCICYDLLGIQTLRQFVQSPDVVLLREGKQVNTPHPSEPCYCLDSFSRVLPQHRSRSVLLCLAGPSQ